MLSALIEEPWPIVDNIFPITVSSLSFSWMIKLRTVSKLLVVDNELLPVKQQVKKNQVNVT